jgi:hypothetical protein
MAALAYVALSTALVVSIHVGIPAPEIGGLFPALDPTRQ